MFFRNLTLFRFPTSLDFSQIDSILPNARLRPVGPLEMTSRGFISPLGVKSRKYSTNVKATFCG